MEKKANSIQAIKRIRETEDLLIKSIMTTVNGHNPLISGGISKHRISKSLDYQACKKLMSCRSKRSEQFVSQYFKENLIEKAQCMVAHEVHPNIVTSKNKFKWTSSLENIQNDEFQEYTDRVMNSFNQNNDKNSSKKNDKSCRNGLSKRESENSSDDSLRIIEDFEEPTIEINQDRSIINKKHKPHENLSLYSRKRSYSKEDLKIRIDAMLIGNKSPELIISDVEDYDEIEEFESFNVRNCKKTDSNKCPTGPTDSCSIPASTATKSNIEGDSLSPFKGIKESSQIWNTNRFEDNLESVPHIYKRRENILKQENDADFSKLIIAQSDILQKIEERKKENSQYEKVIELLLGKFNSLKTELSYKSKVVKQQAKLINSYQTKCKMEGQKCNKTIKNFLNTSKTIIQCEEFTVKDCISMDAYSEQLEKENEMLKMMLKIHQQNRTEGI